MSMVFMMPAWSDTSGGWMLQMMQNLAPFIEVVAVDDAGGNTRWGNHAVVHSLRPAEKEIRYLTRIGNLAHLVIKKSQVQSQKTLNQILHQTNIDQVFCQYGTYANEFMDVWRKSEIPLFIHFHGYDATFDLRRSDNPNIKRHPENYLDNIRELSRRAVFIANSCFTKNLLLEAGIAEEHVALKYFGIPLAEKGRQHTKTKGIQILHLGRLVDFKSPDRTIKAFELAREQGLDGHLILAGDGPMRTTCELLKSRSPFRDDISILGNVDTPTVKTLLSGSDIFTQHNILGEISRQSECFGVSVLEAMAHGLPVVGTRHGGVVDSVLPGVTGVLSEPGDVEAQAQALLELAANPDLRQKMGDAGRQRVAECFSPQQEVERLRQIMGLQI